jgi:poly-gamma-glutamate synthase PgsB/CapB
MSSLFIAGGCLALLMLLLGIERLLMSRLRSAIPVRIMVMGTRGKTSTTRLIAAGLRESGLRVLAKTTGSEARVVLPDGSEQPIRRWGVRTPLEQRRILWLAARQRCEAIVLEAMSIRPESLRAESTQIIRPQTVVITNTYEDHIADLSDPAADFAFAVPTGATVFVPEDFPLAERERLGRRRALCRVIDASKAEDLIVRPAHVEWPQNLALALAACEDIGVTRETALQGMARARMDVGSLRAWRVRDANSSAVWMAVNAFASNDPRSTMAGLERALLRWPAAEQPVVGLLNLRRDRADRTLQWMDALDQAGESFDRLVVCGSVPMTAQRKMLRRFGASLAVVRSNDPRRIMSTAAELSPSGGTLFGFGNIGGAGMRLVGHWREKGEPA